MLGLSFYADRKVAGQQVTFMRIHLWPVAPSENLDVTRIPLASKESLTHTLLPSCSCLEEIDVIA